MRLHPIGHSPFHHSLEFLKMSRFARSVGYSLCLLIVFLAGCNRTKPDTATAGASVSKEGVDPKDSKAQGGTKKIVPINRDPKSLEGNWVMVLV